VATDKPVSTTGSSDSSSSGTTPVSPELPPVSSPVVDESEETAESLTDARNKILAEHGGIESNIGLGHLYWELGNRLRALLNKVK